MSKAVIIPLETPQGWVAHSFAGDESPMEAMLPAWLRASHFAVRLFGVSVQASIGQKKLSKIVQALRGFPALAESAKAFYSARIDGAGDSQFVAVGATEKDLAPKIIGQSRSIFWQVGPWEDLLLFRTGQLVFRCTSHERDASVFGSRAWLEGNGYTRVTSLGRVRWDITGERVDASTVRLLSEMMVAKR